MIEAVAPGTTGFLLVCLAGYIVLANLLAYAAMAVDKARATKGDWQIPEATLLMQALVGAGRGPSWRSAACATRCASSLSGGG